MNIASNAAEMGLSFNLLDWRLMTNSRKTVENTVNAYDVLSSLKNSMHFNKIIFRLQHLYNYKY